MTNRLQRLVLGVFGIGLIFLPSSWAIGPVRLDQPIRPDQVSVDPTDPDILDLDKTRYQPPPLPSGLAADDAVGSGGLLPPCGPRHLYLAGRDSVWADRHRDWHGQEFAAATVTVLEPQRARPTAERPAP